MDPAPQTHPILSYVLSRIPTLAKPKAAASEFDIEQPPVHSPSPRTPSSAGEFELVERMPGLRHPSVLRAMTRAVADVSAARAALQVLGPRPDHELVDSSRALVAAAEAGDARIPEADAEACRAVVRLDETHGAYEALLEEAEEAFGYAAAGPLALPCDADAFVRVLEQIEEEEEGAAGEAAARCGLVRGHSAYRLLAPGRQLLVGRS